MTTNQTIAGVPRERIQEVISDIERGGRLTAIEKLRALLDAPADTRAETVPKHKFDTLVQHCKRLDGEIAQARAHVNEITLYQQNAVWFWQHDGEDFLESLSCPIIIQPHHLRELLKGVSPAVQPQGEPVAIVTGIMQDSETLRRLVNIEAVVPNTLELGQKLYAEHPAPVAVVLPERKAMPEVMMATWHENKGWNACLDEANRLNTK